MDEGGNGGRKKTSAENVKLFLIVKNVKINFCPSSLARSSICALLLLLVAAANPREPCKKCGGSPCAEFHTPLR